MNLTFESRSMSAARSNVEFRKYTRIMNLQVVRLFPASTPRG